MFPPDACQSFLSWNLPCFDEGRCSESRSGLMARLFLLSLCWFSPGTFLHFSGFIRLMSIQTHQRVCLTTTPGVCTSPHHGNLSCQVSQEPFTLALLLVIVYLSCQSPRLVQCACICMHLVHLTNHWLRALVEPVPAFVFPGNNR